MSQIGLEPGQVASSDGCLIDYIKLGQGPALVICHGSLSNGRDWLWVARLLAPRFTCYVMTRRGRDVPADAAPHSLARAGDDIRALLQVAGNNCHLLAHSFGGFCALETLRQHGAVDRLVLYEPPIALQLPNAGELLERFTQQLLTGDTDAALYDAIPHFMQLPTNELTTLRRSMLWPGMAKLAASWPAELAALIDIVQMPDRYAGMQRPTLLLQGSDSAAHLKAGVSRLQHQLPNACTQEIGGQGHQAHLFAPRQFATLIEEFLTPAA